jgi:hypothetical protein
MSAEQNAVLVDLLTKDTETEIFLKKSSFKYVKRPENFVYLGGRLTGREVNMIADELDRLVGSCWYVKFPCALMILSFVSFLLFFVSLFTLSRRSYGNGGLMFSPLIAFLFLFFASIFWFIVSACKANEKLRQYLEEQNNNNLAPRGIVATLTSAGIVRFSVAAGQYIPAQIPQPYYNAQGPNNYNNNQPHLVAGYRNA